VDRRVKLAANRTAESGGPGVLVVDREPAIRTLLAKALPLYGLKVATAADFLSAAEALRRRAGEFALVLLAMQTPDGPTTLSALRAIEPGVPAVFMTGRVECATEEGLTRLGVLAVVPKPFRMDELAALLLRLANRPIIRFPKDAVRALLTRGALMQKWKNGDEVRRTLGRRKMIVFKKVGAAIDIGLPSEYECRWRNGDGSFGTANIREDELVSFGEPAA
jgi:CheY-like chemotaxis protein/uncharacterized protein YodC (DUF2158 family)